MKSGLNDIQTSKPCGFCGKTLNQIMILNNLMPGHEICDCYYSLAKRTLAKQKIDDDKILADNIKRRRSAIRISRTNVPHDKYSKIMLELDSDNDGDLIIDDDNKLLFNAVYDFFDGKRSGLFVHGITGVGKTIICRALMNEIIKSGSHVCVMRACDMVSDLNEFNSDPETKYKAINLMHYIHHTCKVLMIDDIDKKISPAFPALLYNIIDHYVMHGKRLIITSNVDLKTLGLKIGENGKTVSRRIMEICGDPIEVLGKPWLNGERL